MKIPRFLSQHYLNSRHRGNMQLARDILMIHIVIPKTLSDGFLIKIVLKIYLFVFLHANLIILPKYL